jgi:serine phosphatase RsbU (regulator of sigma subunit)
MKPSALKLSFPDPALEREYRRDYDHRNRHFIRLGCGLSIAVWILITASAHFIRPQAYPHVLFISFAAVIPVLALVAALTFFRRFTPLFTWAAGAANTVTAFAFLYLSFTVYYNQALLSGGMVLMSLYAFFIFRLRFRIALLFSTAYMTVYQGLLLGLGFSPDDLYIISSMIWATQAAFAFSGHLMERTSRNLFLSTKSLSDRNREIERDLVIARMIMDNLLPKDVTALPGVRAEALYIPMDKVGGDFYGIWNDGGMIKFFIADVSGHGLASSYLALVTKLSLDRIDPGAAADRALGDLNDMICDATVKSNFVTAFLGRLDSAGGVFTYSSAGHPPALLFRPGTGEVLELRTAGRALGWFKSAAYREENAGLQKGDRLVLYTDGVTECMDRDGIMFGDEGLKKVIRENAGASPGEFAGALLEALRLHARGVAFDDDITLLVVDIH